MDMGAVAAINPSQSIINDIGVKYNLPFSV